MSHGHEYMLAVENLLSMLVNTNALPSILF